MLTTEKMKMFGGPNDAETNTQTLRNYKEKLVDLPQVSEKLVAAHDFFFSRRGPLVHPSVVLALVLVHNIRGACQPGFA